MRQEPEAPLWMDLLLAALLILGIVAGVMFLMPM
jgi:hypothetical protein